MQNLADSLSQNGLEPLLSHTRTLVALVQTDGTLVRWNPSFDRIKDNLPKAATLQDFIEPSGHALLNELLQTPAEVGQPRQVTLKVQHRRGYRAYDCLLLTLENGNSLLMAEPVSRAQTDELLDLIHTLEQTKRALNLKKIEVESIMAQVDEIAHVDPLTFLSNRRQIIASLQREVAQCDRYGKSLTIFMVDIDHFKRVNDTYGHSAGDRVLQTLSSRMRDALRLSDTIGRYGGEEFIILLPGTLPKPAIKLAGRLLTAVSAEAVEIGAESIHCTISIGIAQYQNGTETWKELLDRADKAMYVSKNNGRDQWSMADQTVKTDDEDGKLPAYS